MFFIFLILNISIVKLPVPSLLNALFLMGILTRWERIHQKGALHVCCFWVFVEKNTKTQRNYCISSFYNFSSEIWTKIHSQSNFILVNQKILKLSENLQKKLLVWKLLSFAKLFFFCSVFCTPNTLNIFFFIRFSNCLFFVISYFAKKNAQFWVDFHFEKSCFFKNCDPI